MRRAAAACAAAWLGVSGCTQRPSAQDDADVTLQKLKQLQAAAGKQPPRLPAPSAPSDTLAQLSALGAEDPAPRPRALPASNPTAYAGTVALKLVELSTTRRVAAGRLRLVTADTFLLVKLLAQNVGKAAQGVDLASAQLVTPEGKVSLAPDVQRAVGTQPLQPQLEPGGEEVRAEWTLAFELPPALLGKGLALELGGARIPLE
ncbi:MAG: hypothetical protein FJ086_15015 [Deltaproteobacteria bacterium]|nr:hypothetical protein [Deltaproteobacteria bacterium]